MPPPFFVWEFAFDWQEALLVPLPRWRGKPRRYKKAYAVHAFLARVPIVPVLVPVPVHGVVFAKTSSSPWSGSIRALVYVNVYRFAVDVYGSEIRNPQSAIPLRPAVGPCLWL